MANILGLSFGYHDAAAALIIDGNLVACMQEERFTRIKNDASFPYFAINACLQQGGITTGDLDRVVFYEDIFLKTERVLRNAAADFPRAWKQFPIAIASQFGDKIWVLDQIAGRLKIPRNKIICAEHHLSHAASCFLPSPFTDAAIITVDGVGEDTTTSIWRGEGSAVTPLRNIAYPHSIGLLYAALTAYLGFEVNSGEYKVMGLAAFGKPAYKNAFSKMVKVSSDGSYLLNLDFFAHHTDTEMGFSAKMEALLGARRQPGKPWNIEHDADDRRFADIAASLQWITEELMLAIAKEAKRLTGSENLCLAGGVALNCVANRRLLNESGFARMFVQPAAGDAGGALGAAAWGAIQCGDPRIAPLTTCALGTKPNPSRAIALCKALGLRYSLPDDVHSEIASQLAQQRIVAVVNGRFEWGPRALGMRSILANPQEQSVRDRLNLIVKKREIFRPFAPAVLATDANSWFDDIDEDMSPFMTSIAVAKPHTAEQIPACVHVDGSSRTQTVTENASPVFFHVLERFKNLTGLPILLNTSLNVNNEPIVASEAEAINFFLATPIETMVIENVVIER